MGELRYSLLYVLFVGFSVPLNIFRRRFYGSDDPPNSVTTLKDVNHVNVNPTRLSSFKGGGALCAGDAVALLVFGPVMP